MSCANHRWSSGWKLLERTISIESLGHSHSHASMYVCVHVHLCKCTTNKWGKEGICTAATGTAEFCGIVPSTFIEINTFSVHSNSLGSSR